MAANAMSVAVLVWLVGSVWFDREPRNSMSAFLAVTGCASSVICAIWYLSTHLAWAH